MCRIFYSPTLMRAWQNLFYITDRCGSGVTRLATKNPEAIPRRTVYAALRLHREAQEAEKEDGNESSFHCFDISTHVLE